MVLIPFKRSPKKRFERLLQPHLEALYRFAFRLTGQQQDAEDLVQDVVVKLYPRLQELEQVEQLRPWLNRVLYRYFIDRVRRLGRQADRPVSDLVSTEAQSTYLDSFASDSSAPDEQLDLARLGATLSLALQSLSPDQRTLVLLHDVDGWRQDDIAAVLDIPVGTVKSRLHRCRASLRKKLQSDGEPFPGSERVED